MSDEVKELPQYSQEEFSDLMSEIDKYAVAKDWDSLNALFDDRERFMDTMLGDALITFSRFYDNWLSDKRQLFIDEYIKHDCFDDVHVSHLEGMRTYSADECKQGVMLWGPMVMMGIRGLGPEGFIANPELMEELIGEDFLRGDDE